MSNESYDITHALLRRAESLVLSPALRVAGPNRNFTPRTDEEYLDISVIRTTTQRLFVESRSVHQHIGFMQIAVMTRLGRGELAALEVAEKIVEWFPEDLKLPASNPVVRISRTPEVVTAMNNTAWWRLPVLVYYEALV